MNRFTCEDFIEEYLDAPKFDSFIARRWQRGDWATKTMFEYVKGEAAKAGIELTDADTLDYQAYFEDWYASPDAEEGI